MILIIYIGIIVMLVLWLVFHSKVFIGIITILVLWAIIHKKTENRIKKRCYSLIENHKMDELLKETSIVCPYCNSTNFDYQQMLGLRIIVLCFHCGRYFHVSAHKIPPNIYKKLGA